MVIGGEKTPAFSGRTLNLPLPNADNSGRIIEHTRENYSRDRSEVENEIADLVQPGRAGKSASPQSQTQTAHGQIIKHLIHSACRTLQPVPGVAARQPAAPIGSGGGSRREQNQRKHGRREQIKKSATMGEQGSAV